MNLSTLQMFQPGGAPIHFWRKNPTVPYVLFILTGCTTCTTYTHRYCNCGRGKGRAESQGNLWYYNGTGTNKSPPARCACTCAKEVSFLPPLRALRYLWFARKREEDEGESWFLGGGGQIPAVPHTREESRGHKLSVMSSPADRITPPKADASSNYQKKKKKKGHKIDLSEAEAEHTGREKAKREIRRQAKRLLIGLWLAALRISPMKCRSLALRNMRNAATDSRNLFYFPGRRRRRRSLLQITFRRVCGWRRTAGEKNRLS